MTGAPTLKAYRLPFPDHLGAWLIAWCDFCRRYHWHGGGAGPGKGDGHRVANCHNPKSPYAESGYFLVECGLATPEIRDDLERQQPRGPRRTRGSTV